MPSDELNDLRRTVRDFLQHSSPSAVVRELMTTDAGYDTQVWRRMATQLGLPGIAVPERWGGAGAGLTEITVVCEEMGAALCCSPFFSTVALAIPAILASADHSAMDEFLPRLVDGSATATMILNGQLAPWDPAAVRLRAWRDGGSFRLAGEAPMVLDGHTADLILAAADTDAGISLVAVPGNAAGVERTALATLDRTRKVARLQFDDVPARLIGQPGQSAPGLARVSDLAIVALTAEQIGAAQRCLDMGVDYAKQRIQFGRPIGSFQAIKHRCADMLIAVEGARSAVMHAAQVPTAPELATAAAVAKLVCSEAFLQTALDNMRIHGGIGFTWEHDAHLFVRRAKSTQLMFGSPDHHAQRLGDLIDERTL